MMYVCSSLPPPVMAEWCKIIKTTHELWQQSQHPTQNTVQNTKTDTKQYKLYKTQQATQNTETDTIQNNTSNTKDYNQYKTIDSTSFETCRARFCLTNKQKDKHKKVNKRERVFQKDLKCEHPGFCEVGHDANRDGEKTGGVFRHSQGTLKMCEGLSLVRTIERI